MSIQANNKKYSDIRRSYKIVALCVSVIAGGCYASFPLAIWLNAPFAFRGEVSVLGEAGQPHATLFNSLDIISGCLLIGLGLFLLLAYKNKTTKSWLWALWTLSLSGVGAVLAAILPLPVLFTFPASLHALVHIGVPVFAHGFASFVNTASFITSTALWAAIVYRQNLARIKRLPIAASMILIAVIGPILGAVFPRSGDIIQRIFILLFAIWLVIFTHDVLYSKQNVPAIIEPDEQ